MTITENLDAFLDDFGVTCTAGAVTALGILDMPSQVLLSDAILSTDYTLTKGRQLRQLAIWRRHHRGRGGLYGP